MLQKHITPLFLIYIHNYVRRLLPTELYQRTTGKITLLMRLSCALIIHAQYRLNPRFANVLVLVGSRLI